MKLAITPLALSTATLGLMLGVAQNAQAGVIVSTDMGSQTTPTNGTFNIRDTVNKAGLVPNSVGPLHVASSSSSVGTSWQSVQKLGIITFQFTSAKPVTLVGFKFWNLSGDSNTPNRGLQNVWIEYNDGTTWKNLLGTSSNPFRFKQGASSTADQGPSDDIDFAGVLATQVRFNVQSNYGGMRSGFAEIQFKTIPEPSASLALLALGLVGIGLRKRI
ncbi:hypothetical protein NIES3804_40430 [Microcystis aeruginosa NIES-3804]|uniref:Ice-binding protein C-terminal domain-containing protein n=1 Tax=Microcystis aeruginosa NIES-3804 TaxID=2517783 RepID=A0A6H9G483_MICAE|nr:PEP-CTERM sorting domain-containing protein [Microcystis aeruginosa]GCL52453.1 hypothetical protein NIES3804_40430 [Microcystis aeruginosa NIES-3804]